MSNIHLLIIDDNHQYYTAFREQFRSSYAFDFANNYKRGLEKIRKGSYDAVLLDVQFPPQNFEYGLSKILPEAVRLAKGRFPILLASTDDRPDTLSKVLKIGGTLLLAKSEYDPEKWDFEIRRAIRRFHDPAAKTNVDNSNPAPGQEGFVVKSKAMEEIKQHLASLVKYPHVAILIEGETGVGKEVAVRFLHAAKNNPKLPFIPINLVSFNEGTLQRELFGTLKGAYTDAQEDRAGLFEAAQEGTLFLDEIGEIGKEMQSQLLRVLEDRTFLRMGSTNPIELKAQLVFATNVDLEKAMAEGKFRPDFYERINGERIYIPPLRERREEILPLMEHFLPLLFTHDSHPFFKKTVQECFSQEALQILTNYDWPANIRQLRNVMQKMVIAVDTKGRSVVDTDMIPQQFKFPSRQTFIPSSLVQQQQHENVQEPTHSWHPKKVEFFLMLQRIDQALKNSGGIKMDAAKALGFRNEQNIRSRIKSCNDKFPELLDSFPALKNAYKINS